MSHDHEGVGPSQEFLELGGPRDLARLRGLIDRYRQRAPHAERVIVGVVGEPGAGKSSLTAELRADLGDLAALVPMDGFHLANAVLEQLGARGRKGAPDTFDAHGFAHLVQRLRHQREEVVYAPEFLREVDEAIAGSIPVHRSVPVVIVEGNYLLLDEPPWRQVRECLDAAWYVDLDREVRLERLAARHQRHGLAPEEARRWARVQDEGNARLIRSTRSRADVVIGTS